MPRLHSNFLLWLRAACCLLLGGSAVSAGTQSIATEQRTLHTHAWGDRTYTCLVIDGGVVPLIFPPESNTKVQDGASVTISWPDDGDRATIRRASPEEAALVDLMGTPAAADAWKKHMASTFPDTGYSYEVNEFQPDVLDVNHWRIGAITMDYTAGGLSYSALLMIWRCEDGSTLAITMQAYPEPFKAHCRELYAMIGGSLILQP